ncbi:MAG: hypothetical protein AAGD96_21815, partial [Chloroflexota bacterium]
RVAILRQGESLFIDGGYFDDTLQFVQQFKLPITDLVDENNSGTIRVVANQDTYDVYLNDIEMISDIPSIYAPGWHGFLILGNAVAIDNASIQIAQSGLIAEESGFFSRLFGEDNGQNRIANSIPFEGQNLIASSNGQLEQIGWQPFNGVWTERNGIIIQGSTTQSDARMSFDKSYERFQLEVDLWHPNSDGGAGIMFNMLEPNGLPGAYLVRFTNDGAGIFIGQFDQNGGFEGQDFFPTEPLGGSIQNLRLVNTGFLYQLYLNDQPIFGELQAASGPTFFGLVSNQSEVAYERIFLSSLNSSAVQTEGSQSAPPAPVSAEVQESQVVEQAPVQVEADTAQAETADAPSSNPEAELASITGEPIFQASFLGVIGESNWVPFNGDWSIENGALLQTNQNGYDFAIGFNEQYGEFVLRAKFTHLEGKGGGILFGMERPDSRNLSQVVRYDSDQSAILFGYFDENGQFNAQGGEAVSEPLNAKHQFDVVK